MSDQQDDGPIGGDLPQIGMTHEEAQRMVLEHALQETINAVVSFVGDRIPTDQIRQAAQRAVAEQKFIVERILEDVCKPDPELPRWGMKLTAPNQQQAQFLVAKDPFQCDMAGQGHYVHAIALASSPVARALFYALGHQIEWLQAKAPRKIIV